MKTKQRFQSQKTMTEGAGQNNIHENEICKYFYNCIPTIINLPLVVSLILCVPVQISILFFSYFISIYFVHVYSRPLVFLSELFYIVLSGPFIAHYAVWALLIVEGRMVTYSC